MGTSREPPNLRPIFDKPGRDWTEGERDQVLRWLFEKRQQLYLRSFALRQIGPPAALGDAEEAWGDFYLHRLLSVISSYDPARGRRFWSWLLYCLARYCHKIRKTQQILVPLEVQVEVKPGEHIASVLAVDDDPTGNPERMVLLREFLGALSGALKNLPAKYRDVFTLRIIEGRSERETAKILQLSKIIVKVRLHRLRKLLRKALQDHLPEEGRTP